MPRTVTSAQLIAYLRALAETGNATLAAEAAGVSRDWAYKKRKQDSRFDGWCREMGSQAKTRLTRLDTAKEVILDFISGRKTDRIGVIVFGKNPYVLSPPTLDYDLLATLVQKMELDLIDGHGTAIGDWTYGLGAGFVGSYDYEGTFRGRPIGGVGYVEYVDLR